MPLKVTSRALHMAKSIFTRRVSGTRELGPGKRPLCRKEVLSSFIMIASPLRKSLANRTTCAMKFRWPMMDCTCFRVSQLLCSNASMSCIAFFTLDSCTNMVSVREQTMMPNNSMSLVGGTILVSCHGMPRSSMRVFQFFNHLVAAAFVAATHALSSM